MKEVLKKWLEDITFYQLEFIKNVLTEVWNEDPYDYSIDINSYWLVTISDMYMSFDDFVVIAKYNIPRDIVFEYLDDISLNYESPDIEKYKESIKDIKDFNGNLLWFYRFKESLK